MFCHHAAQPSTSFESIHANREIPMKVINKRLFFLIGFRTLCERLRSLFTLDTHQTNIANHM